jgi:hypothetical protein
MRFIIKRFAFSLVIFDNDTSKLNYNMGVTEVHNIVKYLLQYILKLFYVLH